MLHLALLALAAPTSFQQSASAPPPAGGAPRGTAATVTRAPRVAQTVNAPVAPDTIYVARGGPFRGISVVDLNGFGQSTGDPTFDPLFGPQSRTHTKFPWNPNLAILGSSLLPPLAPGTSTLDGGSAGVFTLTRGTALDDVLTDPAALQSVSDLMLGRPLDLVFNNGLPFGCRAGGGNVCSWAVVQRYDLALTPQDSLAPSRFAGGAASVGSLQGPGNVISFAPSPNPPGLVPTPLCTDPFIGAAEPTSSDSAAAGLPNLLVPGLNSRGLPALGIPPDSMLARAQNAFFHGPGTDDSQGLQSCPEFSVHQQIGHFLYVADRHADAVLVVNSNTMEVLDRIPVEDPCELAMDGEVSILAVSSPRNDEVVFISVDPFSFTFHRVIQRTPVGSRPTGIAWDGAGEDLVVCNEGDGSVSLISSFGLNVRKTLGGLDRPFAVAVTPRQDRFGHLRNTYYAWILQRSGRLALFESGPDGPNGWGYDAIVGEAPFTLPHPRALQADPLTLEGAVWVAHRNQLDAAGVPVRSGGALTKVSLTSAITGVQPLPPGSPPNLRGLGFAIEASLGADVLSGLPLDVAFDNQVNVGALTNFSTPFSAGSPAPANGKALVRRLPTGRVLATNRSQFLFVPVRTRADDSGCIDVFDLATLQRVDTDAFLPGVQSIAAPGALGVMDYFRQ